VKTLYLCLAGSDFSMRIEMTRGITTVGESAAVRKETFGGVNPYYLVKHNLYRPSTAGLVPEF
jgi:hypothetical protein